jgi:triphosphoribosyl-dephospho-CoA synthase
MPRLTESATRDAFLSACRAEIAALKPGNVHVHAGGHGMEIAHFEAAAIAAAPAIADPLLALGARIERAVDASMTAAGLNTNLGIVLLTAPLAVAAQHGSSGDLRTDVQGVLANIDRADTEAVYAAIRRANPGGLGSAPEQDVRERPTVGLLKAMAIAAPRDRIAQAYVDGFSEIFEFGRPVLQEAKAALPAGADPGLAVTTLHMAYLAQKTDSHILRKFGDTAAAAVQQEARRLRALWTPVVKPESIAGLFLLDKALKAQNLNPGTTADFVVATLFAHSICRNHG